MEPLHIATLLHVLMFVYWLGGDLGVYYSAYFIVDPKLSPAQRATAARIMGDLDLVPRFCLILAVPTGLWLMREVGWVELPVWMVGAAFVAAGFWIWLVVHLHHHATAFWRRLDMALRLALVAGLVLWAVMILTDRMAMPGFLAAKMLILAVIVCIGLAVRVVLHPFGPAFGQLMAKGSSPEVEQTLSGTIARVRPMIWLIYLGTASAAYLGIAQPF